MLMKLDSDSTPAMTKVARGEHDLAFRETVTVDFRIGECAHQVVAWLRSALGSRTGQ